MSRIGGWVKKMKNVLILEDDELEQGVLCTIVRSVRQECHVFACRTRERAYYLAMEHRIHLFLIDVRLEGESDFSGFKFVQNIRQIEKYREAPVIFISSVQGYELMAFRKIHCYDFIRKPFHREEVLHIIEQALCSKLTDGTANRIDFETGGIYYPVEEGSIRYLESNRRKIYIHTINDTLELPDKSLKECYALLDKYMFCQIHKSYIISRKYIYKIDFSKREMYLKGAESKDKVMIGMKYKEELQEWLDDN